MSRETLFFLEDIETACNKISRFTQKMSFAEFIKDEKTFDAVIRNLEIVGEAAKHLNEETCRQMPEIEWKKIKGLRDIVAHEYFGIDVEIIWNIVCCKIPELNQVVRLYKANALK